MEPETKTTKKGADQAEQFELIFTNGALANLKNLAQKLNVPEDKLGDVVNRGIKILSVIKNIDAKTVTIDTKSKERFTIDADRI